MDNKAEPLVCESMPNYLKELEGDEIVSAEVIDGGDKICRRIEIKLKSGKFLHMQAQLDAHTNGIWPRIKYGVGGWIKVNTKEKGE